MWHVGGKGGKLENEKWFPGLSFISSTFSFFLKKNVRTILIVLCWASLYGPIE